MASLTAVACSANECEEAYEREGDYLESCGFERGPTVNVGNCDEATKKVFECSETCAKAHACEELDDEGTPAKRISCELECEEG